MHSLGCHARVCICGKGPGKWGKPPADKAAQSCCSFLPHLARPQLRPPTPPGTSRSLLAPPAARARPLACPAEGSTPPDRATPGTHCDWLAEPWPHISPVGLAAARRSSTNQSQDAPVREPRVSANPKGEPGKGVPSRSCAGGRGHPSTVKAERCHLDHPASLRASRSGPTSLFSARPQVVTLGLTASQPRAPLSCGGSGHVYPCLSVF